MKRPFALLAGLAALVLGADQLSKWALARALPLNGSITVIPDFFDLVNIRNRGAAFGFLNRPDTDWQFWLFLAATGLAVWAIAMLARESRDDQLLLAGLGLVLGGALGNLVDRLRFRAVVDFLDFYWGQWHWPAFNVADMGICAGALLTLLAFWRQARRRGGLPGPRA